MLNISIKHIVNQTDIKIDIYTKLPKIYAIKGPSGIGKTTVLNIIAGLREADEAYIELGERVLTDTNINRQIKIQNRHVGYLFQDYQLFPNMTVYQNLTFMSAMNDHIRKLMTKLKIEHLQSHYPATLSGGEAQRVALARALTTKPDLLLLDEPFSSLDDQTKEEGIALLRRVFNEWQIPIIFVTHSNYEANELADDIISLG
ncbi:ATP-binding cassette domain-containing protein [Staphylococcus sp. SQ8-PEA]|uniref:ATP-binding cassette domain-containing protein n=1 Tax=Staphylococcus marylandisciuri TaxID=2981529 RepID=A0ABT2QMI6_9STAP|nr:ATP-binding cassette domain-containing protein [Staphylococcus marylandisciuri]MCU5745185.1 ATP-binding cassette domain-containing protein [Staphylococcus marylandisciuri]